MAESTAPRGHGTGSKFMGGIKETLGTVMHAEGMKESGREQKRDGDAQAFAAGKGKKHYDPALARKGVGIQHKHMGPNPKKLTEGPCAGCREGTCQVGHEYDAAVCHSCTQGHMGAGHVLGAGAASGVAGHAHGHDHGHHHGGAAVKHGHGHDHDHGHGGAALKHGHGHTHATGMGIDHGHMPAGTTHTHAPSAVAGHNVAYDAAVGSSHAHAHGGHIPVATATSTHMHQGVAPGHVIGHSSTRDLDREIATDSRMVAQLDAEDRRDMAKLSDKLHHCKPEYHRTFTDRGISVCDTCGQTL